MVISLMGRQPRGPSLDWTCQGIDEWLTILRSGYSMQIEVDAESVLATPAKDANDISARDLRGNTRRKRRWQTSSSSWLRRVRQARCRSPRRVLGVWPSSTQRPRSLQYPAPSTTVFSPIGTWCSVHHSHKMFGSDLQSASGHRQPGRRPSL